MEEKNFVLTKENYYSKEANEIYMSVSMFKDFKECELMALAKIKGEYVEEKSDAMIFGGYIHAYRYPSADAVCHRFPYWSSGGRRSLRCASCRQQ